jgi:Flp pilus assembly protein TadG
MDAQSPSWFSAVWRRYWRCQDGAAAAELALMLVLLVVPVLNVVDLGNYVYDRMELENAAQSAAQTAWAQCSATGLVPATVNNNCPGLSSAMSGAAQTSSLGSGVTVSSTAENYCCPGASNAPLVCTGTGLGPVATTTPAACSSGDSPGDYIFVTVSYTYTPLYPAASVASLLTTPITHIAWMRLS